MITLLDSMQTGNAQPDGTIGFFNSDTLILVLIVFIIGFCIGFGLRHLIQVFKDAPDSKK